MFGDFIWFTGVVEDRKDPEKLNRVRVRCHGYHSESRSDIPTSSLPWATVMMPATSSGNSGLQESPHGLVEGSWVVGFFRDGNDCQDAVILGSLASRFDTAPSTAKGFSDSSGTYPKEDYIGVSDVNKHARGDSSEIVDAKIASITTNVPAVVGTAWSEPETPYAPEYPYNRVHETESGHITELDDTVGAERIHEYHKSGTFREIHPDGTIVTRIVKDDYIIVAGDDYVNVKGNVKLTIDANCETYIKGDWDIKVDGNRNTTIGLNDTLTVGQAHTLTAPTGTLTYQNGSIVVQSGNITDTNVTLHTHKHTQGIDGDGNSQADTNSPISGT